MATWIFSMSFMMDDITRPVELDSKKVRVLADHAIENFLPQIGDGGEAHVVHQVIAEVVAQSFDQEYSQDADRHHGPDVVDEGRHEIVQIDQAARSPEW